MIKALFFDIDGTLVSFKTHEIPVDTIEALSRAKERGVRVFISTGRPPQFITNLSAIDSIIDGYITTNGAYNYIGDKLISREPIPKVDVEKIIDTVDRQGCSCMVVGESRVAVYHADEIVRKVFCDDLKITNIDFSLSAEAFLKKDVFQLSPFLNVEQEICLMKEIPGCTSGRWSPLFTDITSVRADKGKGLLAICRALDIDVEETMAFGDGGNDLSIVLQAGVGVSMGNGVDLLKASADYVTSDVDSGGVRDALIHYGVI